MAVQLNERVLALLRDGGSKKALSSTGAEGIPHTVFKDSVTVDGDGNIRFFELLETSRTNKNLTYSLWFRRPVSINVIGTDNTSFEILGVPVRALVTGKEFEAAYIGVREKLGKDADLSTIWIIEVQELREETYAVRREEQDAQFPLIGHIDRRVKKSI